MKPTNNITPEMVESLYEKSNHKILFISIFATNKFHLCSNERLKQMYDFLMSKRNYC